MALIDRTPPFEIRICDGAPVLRVRPHSYGATLFQFEWRRNGSRFGWQCVVEKFEAIDDRLIDSLFSRMERYSR